MALGTTELIWSLLKWLTACNCFQNLNTKRTQTRDPKFCTLWLEGRISCDGVAISSCWCACCSNGFTPDEPTRDRTRSNRGFPNHLTHNSPSLILKWMYKAFTFTTTFHWGPPNVIQLGLAYFRKQKDLYLSTWCYELSNHVTKLERLTCLKSLIT